MSTTIHVSPELLASVDRRAGELGISRNRYIVRALVRAVESETAWSPRLVEELAAARDDPEGQRAMEELVRVVAANRTCKPPPEL